MFAIRLHSVVLILVALNGGTQLIKIEIIRAQLKNPRATPQAYMRSKLVPNPGNARTKETIWLGFVTNTGHIQNATKIPSRTNTAVRNRSMASGVACVRYWDR